MKSPRGSTKNGNEVSDGSNNINGILLLLAGIGLIVFFFGKERNGWIKHYQAPASEHGVMIDKLDVTMGLIMFVFLLPLTPILFGIAYYFRGRKDRKASFITHNNKLEFFWTAIPAVTLLV